MECECDEITQLKLSWQPLDQNQLRGKLKHYVVAYQNILKFDPDSKTNGGQILASKTTGATLTNLQPFANYSVMIAAETSAGIGPFTAPIHCRTQQLTSGPPTAIKVTPSDRNAVVVSWLPPDANPGKINQIMGYILYKRYKPPTSEQVRTDEISINAASSGTGSIYKVIQNLKQGIYYQFWVSAVNKLNREGPTSIVQGYRHEQRRGSQLEDLKGTSSPAYKKYGSTLPTN